MSLRIAGLVTGGTAAQDDQKVEDEIYNLRDENLELKKRLNGQDDKTKKLLVKVQRLQDNVKRNGTGPKSPARRDVELENLVDSLRLQLDSAQKMNSSLKTKASYWRGLHDVETRKRGPYDHVQPRVKSTQASVKRLVPASQSKTARGGLVRANSSSNDLNEAEAATVDEIEKLQSLVNMLRTKLAAKEQELERVRAELDLALKNKDTVGNKDDLDKITLQRELLQAKKRAGDAESQVAGLESQVKTLIDAHEEALVTVQEANDQLKTERRRNQQLEELLRHAEMAKQGEKGLYEIIEELQKEKRTLQEELARLVDMVSNNQLDFLAEDEELANLRNALLAMESKWKAAETLAEQYLREKRELIDRMGAILDELNAARLANKTLQSDYEALKRRFDELEEQLRWLKNGPIPWADIEEALAFLKARKAKGHKDGFSGLIDFDELEEYKKLLEQVRSEYADCFDDLSRTQRLLEIEQALSKELKAELERLKRQLESMKNEYELRLEEDARLLDLRNHRIAMLEAQLNSLAIGGPRTEPVAFISSSVDDEVDDPPLRPGENILDTVMVRAHYSKEGIEYLRSRHLDQFVNAETPQHLLSFAIFDFFDFETAVSCFGIGENPQFDFKARYRFFVNDFFMHYLQTRKASVSICCTSGSEWISVAKAHVLFSDIVQPGQVDSLVYYLDMVSAEDEKTLLGKLELSLKVRIPMTQAIRAYKERTIALNLLTVTDDELAQNRFLSRCASNTLTVQISGCQNLRSYAGIRPSVYAAFRFFDFPPITSETVRDTLSPSFNLLHRLDVRMSSALDQYLKTESLKVYILDDSSQFEGDFCYGVATIPLAKLVSQMAVEGEFDIRTPKNLYGGYLSLQLSWKEAYNAEVEPRILQEQGTASEQTKAQETSAPAHGSSNPLASNESALGKSVLNSSSDVGITNLAPSTELASGSIKNSLNGSFSSEKEPETGKISSLSGFSNNSENNQSSDPTLSYLNDEHASASTDSSAIPAHVSNPSHSNTKCLDDSSVNALNTESRSQTTNDLSQSFNLNNDRVENIITDQLGKSSLEDSLPKTPSQLDTLYELNSEKKTAGEQEPQLVENKVNEVIGSVPETDSSMIKRESRSDSSLSEPSALLPSRKESTLSLPTFISAADKQLSTESMIQVSDISDIATPRSVLSSQTSTDEVALSSIGTQNAASGDYSFRVGINALQFNFANAAVASLLEGVSQLFVCFDLAGCDPETLETQSLPLTIPSKQKLISIANSQSSLGSNDSLGDLSSSKLLLANLKATVTATTSRYQRRRASLAPDTVLHFNFKREIELNPAFKEQESTRTLLREKLLSEDPLENSIFFSIVSEPPSESLSAPVSPAYATECVDIGIAQINLKHWIKKQQQSLEKAQQSSETLPVYDSTGNIQLGTLLISLEGLQVLEAVMRE